MGNINAVRMDLDKEVQGTWVPFRDTDIELKIARWNNPTYVEAEQRVIEQRKVTLGAKELTDDQLLDARKEAASETILVDWRNVEDDDGSVEYNHAKALEYFRDPELQSLWTFVVLESMKDTNFRKQRLEADAGN